MRVSCRWQAVGSVQGESYRLNTANDDNGRHGFAKSQSNSKILDLIEEGGALSAL